MCIPHGATSPRNNNYVKEEKPKKSVKRVSKDIFEKGDPDFVDERIIKEETTHLKSLCDLIFGSKK